MVGRFIIDCIGRSLNAKGHPVQGILPSRIVGVLKGGEKIDDFKVRVQQQQQQQQQDAAGGGADDDEAPPRSRPRRRSRHPRPRTRHCHVGRNVLGNKKRDSVPGDGPRLLPLKGPCLV